MSNPNPCINEGGTTHAWQHGGLDINDKDELVGTRRCVWCGKAQERAYHGPGTYGSWRKAR